jgi:hypothetical protein
MKKAVKKVSSNVTSAFDREAHAKVAELEAAVVQYHEWCVEWRRLNDGLEEELQRTQFMLMDAQAVIQYLESKVMGV